MALLAPVAIGVATDSRDEDAALTEIEQAEEAVEARSRAIEHELKTLAGHPWAGEYYRGDGLGMNVRMLLSPMSGIAATWHGCLGLYGANLGHVLPQADGHLQFDFERGNQQRFGGFPDRVIPVRWGARRYLLEPSELAEFVSAIHRGMEPRAQIHGMFLLAKDDERKPVEGLPDLPSEYRERIRSHALVAQVLRVEPLPDLPSPADLKICDKRYRLHLQVAESGLLARGEILEPEVPDNAFGSVVVEEATPGLAVGVGKFMELDCARPENVPDRDWKFSTGAFDPARANREITQAAASRD